jgi:hypothetical protein
MKCPPLSNTIIFADNPKLAAQVCCALAVPGTYLSVCDGPRLQRPDADAEVSRRHNAAARVKAKAAYIVGLSDASFAAMKTSLQAHRPVSCPRISDLADVQKIPRSDRKREMRTLIWGNDRIGIGLLKALRSGCDIAFEDKPSPPEHLASRRTHLVVCEGGEDLTQVIAANYAFAMNAGLVIIPEVDNEYANVLLEQFYSMYARDAERAPKQSRQFLIKRLSALCGPLPVPPGGSVTFVGKLPFGFAFKDFPSTHLFDYPDLGIAIVNGFAAEQPETPGTGVVVLVDPGTTSAPEIQAAIRLLQPRRAFIRVYEGASANVRAVTEMIDHFPYDLLIIATHCGDSEGYRWTYEFTDSEGQHRTMVVDIAIGLGSTDDPEVLDVAQFMRFASLDGVDWNDPTKKAALYVGTAVLDFVERIKPGPNELKPVKKENIGRVVGSSAMKMSDSNLILMPRPLANGGSLIVVNNACVSWHGLAGNFTFANARAYVGTLFEVSPTEAGEIAVKILDKHWNKPLPVAVWAAQRDVYGPDDRRPYVVTGVFPQRLRVKGLDYPARILKQLRTSLAGWERTLTSLKPDGTRRIENTKNTIKVLRREIDHFLQVE